MEEVRKMKTRPNFRSHIKFTIQTYYSIENYFLEINTGEDIISQINDALMEDAFCDYYEIIKWDIMSEDYVQSREKAITIYEKLFGESPYEDSTHGEHVTLEDIVDMIYYNLNENKVE